MLAISSYQVGHTARLRNMFKFINDSKNKYYKYMGVKLKKTDNNRLRKKKIMKFIRYGVV